MPTEARGNYLPEAPAPYLRETKTYDTIRYDRIDQRGLKS